ncbi:hypothetical protein Mapa_004651 [Marchantia paleacea]|nr:hypothetical protein Mapa_004651 [Marchantia paleacea]
MQSSPSNVFRDNKLPSNSGNVFNSKHLFKFNSPNFIISPNEFGKLTNLTQFSTSTLFRNDKLPSGSKTNKLGTIINIQPL